MDSEEIVIGGRYRLDGIEYRVECEFLDTNAYESDGSLVHSVFYTQLIAGKMLIGTQYGKRRDLFLSIFEYLPE